jgi:hypothetical protein
MKSVLWDISYSVGSDADDLYCITVRAETEAEARKKAAKKIKNLRRLNVANPRWTL